MEKKVYKNFLYWLNKLSDSANSHSLKSCLETDIKIFELAISTLNTISNSKCRCGENNCPYTRLGFLDCLVEHRGEYNLWEKLTVNNGLFLLLKGLENNKKYYYRGNFILYMLRDDFYTYKCCLPHRDMDTYRKALRLFTSYINLYKYILKKEIYKDIEIISLKKEIESKEKSLILMEKNFSENFSKCQKELITLLDKLEGIKNGK